ncbi:NAD-dependent succinate-semialdehyde dehydrogenase [Streptomyces caniscabiei]|uniref:NAD-dependent succinate-semialdehyde dehydrogenase n=1 Tax=Streptomyces caniscabiei TaxID=2746961 RepID=A0ABU4MW42_9ACTN|nr:NAD-dependent succinate-semialdehyde dehydrogenase [Streptomyces caniscabiei]MDX2947549.1 NAD-dependent succinate-semialdehyde dehydrogenase [Streptomyces caniscabiei]MDX2955083.1 NAD-dependent succinate-semialdehyde dehydrogenase [Streptomyces caniscabiei]MDX2989856.1 NAD-dependent succinate-semialdehyde dehydrogenase [Streptomyces caniscabiei]MDX3014079.1 NAD-dependent succinate-semialdehyde dehydrogenase [Streptomyces caniscabiei]MDX3040610.1 NAD-dependent succinate-semialdehyde dehydrog
MPVHSLHRAELSTHFAHFPTRLREDQIVTLQAAPAAARSVNPATGEVIDTYPFVDGDELDAVLRRARQGFAQWSQSSPEVRCAALARMSRLLLRDVGELGALITAEMGKPITQARAEVEKAAWVASWYAGNGAKMIADAPTSIGPAAHVAYRPLGPVLAVEPWNFPVWQVMRGAIPILLGGNAYVLKPAPNVVGCALAVERLWREAGVPEGAFSVLNADNDVVSQAIAHPAIVGVTVTGSVRAGSAIAAQAGRAIKRSVLELGGSDAFIVLGDADLNAAVEAAIHGRFQNSGQICIAAKRIILDQAIADAFTERFVAEVRKLTVGDPTQESTYIGPIARDDIRQEIHRQVERTVAEGARLLTGGGPIEGPGSFFQPTVLADVTPAMTSFREEIFGPVASLVVAEDLEDALAMANDSQFGLSASLWTGDADLASRVAQRLEVGGVFINGIAVSDPRIPIGGVKNSGYGRELSHLGVHEFTNIQAVWNCTPGFEGATR